ncbi:hypothetical protein BT93_J0204 [Corymbia citriodora subsp. variegata]|nr:hypothetical protein BT93_J0204 [Corymbia citriodora subsp. variegata]
MKMGCSWVCATSGFWVVLLVLSRLSCSEGQVVPALFVLGDSIVDVGNNNYLALSVAKAVLPYYGLDFPTKKPNGRFTNGKNSADFMAEKLGLPSPPPYLALISNSSERNNSSLFLTGVSFASGGAGIFDGNDEKFEQSIPLKDQVGAFVAVHDNLTQHMGSPGAQQHVAKSLFLFVIGNNDLFDYSKSSDLQKQYTPQQYVDRMASSLKDQLKRLHSYDARKFVFAGLPPIGCTPARRNWNETGGCREDQNSWARMYNEALLAMLNGLKSELNDISYSYLDLYNIVQEFIQNPSAYGFTEVKAACCGLGNLRAVVPCLPISEYCPNRRDHLFWDSVHPTEATHRIFIDKAFNGSQYTYPMGVHQLAAVET